MIVYGSRYMEIMYICNRCIVVHRRYIEIEMP